MSAQARSNKINSFSPIRESQERVRALLKRGKYDDASITSYGRLGEFIEFLHRFGIYRIFAEMGTENKPMGVSHFLLTMTWLMRSVLGFKAIDKLKFMFQDTHVMRLIGFSSNQVQQGYSKRTRKPGAYKPIHPHTVRNFGKFLDEGKPEIFNTAVIKELRRRGLIKKGVFAMDSKYIFVTGKNFEQAAQVKDFRTNQLKTGYKVILLQYLQKGRHFIVGAMLMPANTPDTKCLLPLVRKAVKILGPGVIRTLLIDRGFLDGRSLRILKEKLNINFVIPGEDRLHIVRDALGLIKLPEHKLRQAAPGIKVSGLPALESYADYGAPLNVVLVQDDNIPKKEKGRIYSYLTTLPVNTVEDTLRVYRRYRQRWDIENRAMRDLTHNWNFAYMPGGSFNLVVAHVLFTIAAFNLVMLFRDQVKREFTGRSIDTIRHLFFAHGQEIAIIIGDEYATFSLEEILQIEWGRPP